MNRLLLIALAGLLVGVGCSQANSFAERQEKRVGLLGVQEEAEKPQSPPKYHVTKKETCKIASQTTKCYSVATDATSTEEFTALTQRFRDQSSGVDAVVITFFFDEPQANSSGMGFAFESEEAARKILSESLPGGADLDKEVNKAMQNDGIYVVSIEDEVEGAACKNWDPRALGPPPEEWECPGY